MSVPGGLRIIAGLLLLLSCKSRPIPAPIGSGADVARDGAALRDGAPTTTSELRCGLGECLHQEPGSLCGSLMCRRGGTGPFRKYGFLHSRHSPFRQDTNLRVQFFNMKHEIMGPAICALEAATRSQEAGGQNIWFDVRVSRDGNLSLYSALGKYIPPKTVYAAPTEPIDAEMRRCMEKSLVGKTLYDPDYVDEFPCSPRDRGCTTTPRTSFPETILQFEVWVPNRTPAEWREGE